MFRFFQSLRNVQTIGRLKFFCYATPLTLLFIYALFGAANQLTLSSWGLASLYGICIIYILIMGVFVEKRANDVGIRNGLNGVLTWKRWVLWHLFWLAVSLFVLNDRDLNKYPADSDFFLEIVSASPMIISIAVASVYLLITPGKNILNQEEGALNHRMTGKELAETLWKTKKKSRNK